jgi:hypothetical protein
MNINIWGRCFESGRSATENHQSATDLGLQILDIMCLHNAPDKVSMHKPTLAPTQIASSGTAYMRRVAPEIGHIYS